MLGTQSDRNRKVKGGNNVVTNSHKGTHFQRATSNKTNKNNNKKVNKR